VPIPTRRPGENVPIGGDIVVSQPGTERERP
jgi:hypothetical protein